MKIKAFMVIGIIIIFAVIAVVALQLTGVIQIPGLSTSPAPSNTDIVDNPGKELYTVGDRVIYEDEFIYWVARTLEYQGLTTTSEDIDWQSLDNSGRTLKDFVLTEAVTSSKVFKAVYDHAKANNYTLTPEEQTSIDNALANLREQYISYFSDNEAEMDQYFKSNGYTERMLKYQQEVVIYYKKLMDETYGENGEKLTDAEAIQWGDDLGLLRAKHILFKTTDDAMQPLSEEEIAAAKQKADDLYAELSGAVGDNLALEALFNERMAELTEDPGGIQQPDGYQFTPGTMMPPFEETTMNLENYGLSEPVDITYGYSIILRLPLAPDMEIMQGQNSPGTLRSTAISDKMNVMIDGWTQDLEVTQTPEFENIDLDALLSPLKTETTATPAPTSASSDPIPASSDPVQ